MNGSLRRCCNPMSRRRFFAAAGAGALAGCATAGTNTSEDGPARIVARPFPPSASINPGEHPLNLGTGRDGVLFVPRGAPPPTGAPLALMLHGAGGSAAGVRSTFAIAEEFGVAVLAPDSRGATWDAIRGHFGPDVAFVNAALQHAFARVAVDPRRLGVGGFSDGASYALSLAIANGDLFTHVLAFSPGFITPASRRGKPRVFISRGVPMVHDLRRVRRTLRPPTRPGTSSSRAPRMQDARQSPARRAGAPRLVPGFRCQPKPNTRAAFSL